MWKVVFTCFIAVGVISCQKCNLKGDELLNENFDTQSDWLLYSEYDSENQIYSRIEDGVLKLKSDQAFESCQRATYNFPQDLSQIKGFQACVKINELRLPKKVDVHFYFSLGNFELHAVIEKKVAKNNLVIFRVDEKGVSSNHKGALFGGIGNEIEVDNFSENFVQISLCPELEEEATGELYIEIDVIEIRVIDE